MIVACFLLLPPTISFQGDNSEFDKYHNFNELIFVSRRCERLLKLAVGNEEMLNFMKNKVSFTFLDADSLSQAKEESRKPGFSTNYADEMSHLRMI